MPRPTWLLPRRTFLKSASACIALPFLDAMIPPNPLGNPAGKARGKPPVRLGWFYAPLGAMMDHWRPAKTGGDFELPRILASLEPVRRQVLVISDLAADQCRPAKGPGHETASGAFLTGMKCRHSEEPQAGGVSIDQLAAQKISDQTPIDSLTLGIDPGMRGDHGYSGTYLSRISWRTVDTPAALELEPKALFDRIFGGRQLRAPTWNKGETAKPATKAATPAIDEQIGSSVLDLLRDDARTLLGNLGSNDRAKMEGYLDGIRSIEKRMDLASQDQAEQAAEPKTKPRAVGAGAPPDLMIPTKPGRPAAYADHVNLMLDILVMAFWTDTTRISTFMFSHEKSFRAYPEIEVPGAHHSISHHMKKPEVMEQLTRINVHHMTLFARMLRNMANLKEGDGTLLDNVALLYGSGMSDSDRHNKDNLPVLLAGGAGGRLKGGGHLALNQKTPICNLYLDMMSMGGMPLEKFGDSTGRILLK